LDANLNQEQAKLIYEEPHSIAKAKHGESILESIMHALAPSQLLGHFEDHTGCGKILLLGHFEDHRGCGKMSTQRV
jgi:hypothetical protein